MDGREGRRSLDRLGMTGGFEGGAGKAAVGETVVEGGDGG